MASNRDTSEEKTLPATPRKLRELRKKGQISHSSDMVAAATTVAAFIFLWAASDWFVQNFKLAMTAFAKIDGSNFPFAAAEMTKILARSIGSFVAILVALVISVTLLANFLINRGFIFSMDPMRLDFNRLNPVEGFKRIFSLRSLFELAKHPIRIALFVFLSLAVLSFSLDAPFQMPFCGPSCFGSTFRYLIGLILLVAILIFLFFGFVDVGVQRWLFLREHRMTKTEAKRERKDEEGAPEIRSTQRRLRQRFLQQPQKYTPSDATIFIEGSNLIVGLRFVLGETPLPVVVCKGQGPQYSELFRIAVENKAPIYIDDELAQGLYQRLEVGSHLTEAFFDPFVRALRALRLV